MTPYEQSLVGRLGMKAMQNRINRLANRYQCQDSNKRASLQTLARLRVEALRRDYELPAHLASHDGYFVRTGKAPCSWRRA